MKKLLPKLFLNSVLLLLVLALMVGLLTIQTSPLRTFPSRDSGFFMYAGNQILKGKLPYIDFWDSKGPGIFYINALGLFLGRGYRWGVWFLEYFLLLLSSFLFYRSVAKKWGYGAALLSSMAWLYGLSRVWEGGNLTEEYALFFSFILLSYFIKTEKGFTTEFTERTEFFNREKKVVAQNHDGFLSNPFRRIGQRHEHFEQLQKKLFSLFSVNSVVKENSVVEENAVIKRNLLLMLGATFALSFLFRANNTGTQISLLAALLLSSLWNRQYKQVFRILGWVMFSAGFVLVLISGYFLQKGIFSEAFNAAILYNFFYAGANNHFRLNFWQGLLKIGFPLYLAVIGYLALLYRSVHERKMNRLALFLLIGFPLEILLSSLSGKGYFHYFISWMPVIALLTAYAYARFAKKIFSTEFLQILGQPRQNHALALFILILIYWIGGAGRVYQQTAKRILFERGQGIERIDPVADFLRKNSEGDDLVLVWGAYPGLNFLSKRDAPTAYLFYPAYEESPYLAGMSLSFWQDISKNPPKIIVDAYSASPDYILSLDALVRQSQLQYTSVRLYKPPYQEQFFDLVERNYRRVDTIDGFDIYLRLGD